MSEKNETAATETNVKQADTIRDNVAAFRGEDNVSMMGGWTDAAPAAE
ncbi:hypothetical protein OOK31_13230 [Streptomyces sp. NBC_00249]|nr:hypothetical protein [Streptomyces sp. NBC_00249]MCX5194850.1 hypothetical protein [Streptomyces sp. NBC_00249]